MAGIPEFARRIEGRPLRQLETLLRWMDAVDVNKDIRAVLAEAVEELRDIALELSREKSERYPLRAGSSSSESSEGVTFVFRGSASHPRGLDGRRRAADGQSPGQALLPCLVEDEAEDRISEIPPLRSGLRIQSKTGFHHSEMSDELLELLGIPGIAEREVAAPRSSKATQASKRVRRKRNSRKKEPVRSSHVAKTRHQSIPSAGHPEIEEDHELLRLVERQVFELLD